MYYYWNYDIITMKESYSKEIKARMGDKWWRTCDLVDTYYDVGARLRSWARSGICERKQVGRFTYYRLTKEVGQARLFNKRRNPYE